MCTCVDCIGLERDVSALDLDVTNEHLIDDTFMPLPPPITEIKGMQLSASPGNVSFFFILLFGSWC